MLMVRSPRPAAPSLPAGPRRGPPPAGNSQPSVLVGSGHPWPLVTGSAKVSHPLARVCRDAAAAPDVAVTVEGELVQGLRARLPVLGHRPAARAALAVGHEGHA